MVAVLTSGVALGVHVPGPLLASRLRGRGAEPSGQHEERNARLWCDLGFGVRYERWRDVGFDPEYLRAPHEALLAALTGPVRPRDAVEALCDPPGPHLVGCVVDHIVVDGESCRIMAEDLFRLYAADAADSAVTARPRGAPAPGCGAVSAPITPGTARTGWVRRRWRTAHTFQQGLSQRAFGPLSGPCGPYGGCR